MQSREAKTHLNIALVSLGLTVAGAILYGLWVSESGTQMRNNLFFQLRCVLEKVRDLLPGSGADDNLQATEVIGKTKNPPNRAWCYVLGLIVSGGILILTIYAALSGSQSQKDNVVVTPTPRFSNEDWFKFRTVSGFFVFMSAFPAAYISPGLAAILQVAGWQLSTWPAKSTSTSLIKL